jgi:hypothetical protein
MYMMCNNELHLCSHCCIGKTTSIMYSEIVFVALVIWYVMSVLHFVICDLPGCTVFFHVIS